MSAETTLNADLADYEALQPVLWRLSERVALRLKRSGLAGRSVTLKLKNRTFRLRTRARSGLPPTQLATRLYEAALPLLRAECDGTTFRLMGSARQTVAMARRLTGATWRMPASCETPSARRRSIARASASGRTPSGGA